MNKTFHSPGLLQNNLNYNFKKYYLTLFNNVLVLVEIFIFKGISDITKVCHINN